MSEISFDAIHWGVAGDGSLRPRAVPAPLNYPEPPNVLQSVVYGYENQYTGTLESSGQSPATPIIMSATKGDGQITVDVILNSSLHPAYIIYKPAVGGWTLPDETLRLTESGTITIPGLHNGVVYYVCAVSKSGLTYSLPSNMVSARPEQGGLKKARYRVVGIKHMPGAATKTLVLERVERPIHP